VFASTKIEVVRQQFPHDDLVFPEKTLRLKFQEGVKLLRDSGWKEEDGSEPGDYDDLSTKGEQRLGQIIKEKYNTDYYILGE
jgi:aspartyl/asparaginyl-tRNA synthetase